MERRVYPLNSEGDKRLRRLDRLSWVLDRSIPLGKWRIGLDPILGLMPGAGDWIGAILSLYVLYEGARLGVPRPVLTRMAGNILVETVVGAVPVVGDIFDFAWQSNTKNMKLIQEHYDPALRPRSLRWVGFAVLSFAILVFFLIGLFAFLIIRWVINAIGW